MSSIFGAWQSHKKPLSPDSIQQVVQKTAWWKPEITGHYHDKEIFLGHQFAAPKKQPSLPPSQDRQIRLHIVADVRLDNRNTLLALLNIEDTTFSDTRLILESYKRFGKNCVNHLIGAFAFAIWDEKTQQLFCARDHMGVKPFNYYFRDQLFAFGTQKKSILALEDIDQSPNWRYIFNQLSSLGIPPHSTAYLHIKKLPPAHFLVISPAGMQLQRYWDLDIHKTISYQKEEDYILHFRTLFQQATHDRIPVDQPVGTHLSGGLDSSGITAVAHEICQNKGQALHAFGYGVPRDFQSENMDFVEENLLAFDLIDYCKLKNFHNITQPIPRNFRNLIEVETMVCDGFSQSNNVNTEYELQAAAQAQNVSTILSGFPGDELVTSFCRPFYLEYLERGQWANYFLKDLHGNTPFKTRLQAFLAAQSVRWIPCSLQHGRRSVVREYWFRSLTGFST